MGTYLLGQRGEVPVQFTTVATGAFIDPGTVRLKIWTPGRVLTTYTHPNAQITKSDTGRYTTSILFNYPGKWQVRWEGTGSNEAAFDHFVHVNGSPFYDQNGDEIPDS
jgi:hypothetical protein